MKKTRSIVFLVGILIVFIAADMLLTARNPVGTSTLFNKNDYEKTIVTHGGTTQFDRVFYGNSAVISAYNEAESGSGYVNFGIDYGTVTDLVQMLDKRLLTVNSELVVGLNYFVLMDTLDTNSTYPWHRKAWEPYAYFHRTRFSRFITTGVQGLLNGQGFTTPTYGVDKTVYHGQLTPEELDDKIAIYQERYWHLGLEHYQQNLDALSTLADYCSDHGIRLRAVWMPLNSYCPLPQPVQVVVDAANEILSAQGVTVLDMTDALSPDCFHDMGHLTYEYGASLFTKEIDTWLLS